MVDLERLSSEAKRLIELAGDRPGYLNDQADIAGILQQHPELMEGLNEFLQWRSATATSIAKEETARPVGHSIGEALKGMKEPKK